jgi:hypothetical protein
MKRKEAFADDSLGGTQNYSDRYYPEPVAVPSIAALALVLFAFSLLPEVSSAEVTGVH